MTYKMSINYLSHLETLYKNNNKTLKT